MAEGDPKKLRTAGAPDRRSFEADEDPLVELARIVSEDSGFYGGRSEKPKAQVRQAQAQPRRDEPSDRNAISADLEAELLQELESSFASQRSVPPSRSRTATRPAFTPPPADDADDLLRSIEEQLGEFERRARSMQAEMPAPDEPSMDDRAWEDEPVAKVPRRPDRKPGTGADEAWTAPAPPGRTDEPRTPAPAPVAEWAVRPVARTQGRDEPRLAGNGAAARAEAAEEERLDRPALRRREAAPAPERRVAPQREPTEQRISGEASRPDRIATNPPQRYEAPIRANGAVRPGDGWDSIVSDVSEDVTATFGGAPETHGHPGPADAMPDIEVDLARGVPSAGTDPDFDRRWAATVDDASDEPRVAAAMIPPPRPRPAARQGRSGRGLAAAAGVLGVVALGAAVAAYLRSEENVSSEPPPVIAAEQSAVKVEAPPPPEATEGETVGDAVYERVAGSAPAAEEQVVESSEEPREVARIVLPPSQEDAAEPLARPVGEGETASTAATDEAALAGPRRVRTYVVRPDGTIVEGAAPAEAPPPEEAVVLPAVGEPIAPVQVATTEIDEAGDPASVSAIPTTPGDPEVIESPAVVIDAPPAPEMADEAIRPSVIETPSAPEPVAAVAEEPPPAAPAPVAVSEPEAIADPPAAPEPPLEVAAAPPTAEPEPAPAASVAGGFLIQLSSQRSQDAAQSSFADMQRRFPSILGDARPVIQQADLGEQGVYYRVRVGPWATRSEAITVCEQLQSAGGDCFVTQ